MLKIAIPLVILLIGCNTPADKPNGFAESTADTTSILREQPGTASHSTPDKTKSTPGASPNFYILTGDWVRSDGDYIIRINNIAANGTFKAEYFNPNPIKVGNSRWESEDDSLYLQVELRDVNYPGSTYTLQYIPVEDKLSGIYFQAVEGATYEVVFNRKK